MYRCIYITFIGSGIHYIIIAFILNYKLQKKKKTDVSFNKSSLYILINVKYDWNKKVNNDFNLTWQ